MGKTNLGRVTFVPRGAYSNEASYKRLDVVEHEGSSYLFLKDSTGIAPTGDGEVTMFLAKKGKDFTYDDFSPEQLAALKGAKGDKGDPGKGLTILGYYGTLDLLKASVTAPEAGDAYGIGSTAPYNIYVYDSVTSDWVDNGTMSGGGESGGNVVLIPAEIMGLSNTSTSEEILAAWGGRDNLISICKKLNDRKAICKLHGGDENQSEMYLITVVSTKYTDDNNAIIELYVGAGSSSLMLQVSLTNGVASFNMMSQDPVTSTKLPDAIFELTSQSTSEQILSVFGGIDKIKDIYNKIGYSGETQYDILIANKRNRSNGYSVLHNFGGYRLSASQNNGFDSQIHFAYTSIDPIIEVTQWVIKFNDTSAACEVTKRELGSASSGGGVAIIPAAVVNLENTSTSNEILNVFGGKEAFIDLVTKVKDGIPTTILGQTNGAYIYEAPKNLIAGVDRDSNSYILMFTGIGSSSFSITIELTDDIATFAKNDFPLVLADKTSMLTKELLVSDPSVGGTNVPASAEAVKALLLRIEALERL